MIYGIFCGSPTILSSDPEKKRAKTGKFGCFPAKMAQNLWKSAFSP
jgi:hypothetical protein